jgi:hypothetical protein
MCRAALDSSMDPVVQTVAPQFITPKGGMHAGQKGTRQKGPQMKLVLNIRWPLRN